MESIQTPIAEHPELLPGRAGQAPGAEGTEKGEKGLRTKGPRRAGGVPGA